MKKIINLVILIVFMWCVVSAVRPYWSRYCFKKDLEAAAIYGTKNGIEDTRRFLNKKMEEQGRDFDGEDLIIEKDENNNVRLILTYSDKISAFSIVLKELEFTVKATAREVKEYF
jgi:hypothetical protein